MKRIYFKEEQKNNFIKNAEKAGADYVDTEDFNETIAVFKGDKLEDEPTVAIAIREDEQIYFGEIDALCDNFQPINFLNLGSYYNKKQLLSLQKVIKTVIKSDLL